jgi:hypothetical protein
MAFIEFNEFNEFSLEHGLEFGEPLLETDLEDILDAKLNLSYLDYKVSKYDYFMGCPTMLTSEKAALAKVSKIYYEHKQHATPGQPIGKFIDKDFGPMRDSDYERCRFTMYKTGEMPKKGLPDPHDVIFAFPDTITDKPI